MFNRRKSLRVFLEASLQKLSEGLHRIIDHSQNNQVNIKFLYR